MLIETADSGLRTVTDPSGPRPCTAIVRAMDSRQSQLQPEHRTQHTPEEPPGLKSRSRPPGLEGRPQGDGELQRRSDQGPCFTSPHNDPLVVEIKVASAIVWRILADIGSFVDIITWDCLKKLKYLGREIVFLVHPILRFRGQEMNPIGIVHPPLCFGDKAKARTLEVDFLVIDVPTAYNAILGRPTLHKVKVVIAPYLLQLQFRADDGSMGTMQEDQRMARECYLVSIRPLVERMAKRGAAGPPPPDRRPQPRPPLPTVEALIIHMLTSAEPDRPRWETADGVEQVPLDEGCLKRTVALRREIKALVVIDHN
ncbi:hypothetical protein Cgig2_021931 [Carnegiea gigantea]|uniref:Uncharacterized protein n=1 Tax=Carnegiea gigantea TaxID=171969 RepID=A0A9Q1GJB7_9CARY|nr:hypothetical protein Cgig2_021931 [Carnegiea gigantea]